MDKCLLKLFIAGNTTKSFLAITNVKKLCENELEGRYELIIIDVMKKPQQAEEMGILATPTLIKRTSSSC